MIELTALAANAWIPVLWEPVVGTGERLTVGALVRIDGQVTAHSLIRSEILDCLYGKHARGAEKLIEQALGMARIVAEDNFLQVTIPMEGFFLGQVRHTHPTTISDALQVCALMHSSIAALDGFDEPEERETPTPEETNKRFSTEVRDAVVAIRPELAPGFGRQAVISNRGVPVRFGYLSESAVIHFSVLNPIRQPASVLAARARLWELARARDLAQLKRAALIMAVPRHDEPTIGARSRDAVRINSEEIEREADEVNMRFIPVNSVTEAADRVIDLVD